MGIPFSKIKPYINSLNIVILSHLHLDHFNISCIKRIQLERPSIRFAVGEHMREAMAGIRNVDVLELNRFYDYRQFKISCFKLHHDIENVGWRIFVKQPDGSYYKIFRATDTYTLEGLTAKNYDLMALEHNYDEETVHDIIRDKRNRGEYAHQIGSINSHLSVQQAQDFIFKNKGEKYEVVRLHESKSM